MNMLFLIFYLLYEHSIADLKAADCGLPPILEKTKFFEDFNSKVHSNSCLLGKNKSEKKLIPDFLSRDQAEKALADRFREASLYILEQLSYMDYELSIKNNNQGLGLDDSVKNACRLERMSEIAGLPGCEKFEQKFNKLFKNENIKNIEDLKSDIGKSFEDIVKNENQCISSREALILFTRKNQGSGLVDALNIVKKYDGKINNIEEIRKQLLSNNSKHIENPFLNLLIHDENILNRFASKYKNTPITDKVLVDFFSEKNEVDDILKKTIADKCNQVFDSFKKLMCSDVSDNSSLDDVTLEYAINDPRNKISNKNGAVESNKYSLCMNKLCSQNKDKNCIKNNEYDGDDFTNELFRGLSKKNTDNTNLKMRADYLNDDLCPKLLCADLNAEDMTCQKINPPRTAAKLYEDLKCPNLSTCDPDVKEYLDLLIKIESDEDKKPEVAGSSSHPNSTDSQRTATKTQTITKDGKTTTVVVEVPVSVKKRSLFAQNFIEGKQPTTPVQTKSDTTQPATTNDASKKTTSAGTGTTAAAAPSSAGKSAGATGVNNMSIQASNAPQTGSVAANKAEQASGGSGNSVSAGANVGSNQANGYGAAGTETNWFGPDRNGNNNGNSAGETVRDDRYDETSDSLNKLKNEFDRLKNESESEIATSGKTKSGQTTASKTAAVGANVGSSISGKANTGNTVYGGSENQNYGDGNNYQYGNGQNTIYGENNKAARPEEQNAETAQTATEGEAAADAEAATAAGEVGTGQSAGRSAAAATGGGSGPAAAVGANGTNSGKGGGPAGAVAGGKGASYSGKTLTPQEQEALEKQETPFNISVPMTTEGGKATELGLKVNPVTERISNDYLKHYLVNSGLQLEDDGSIKYFSPVIPDNMSSPQERNKLESQLRNMALFKTYFLIHDYRKLSVRELNNRLTQ